MVKAQFRASDYSHAAPASTPVKWGQVGCFGVGKFELSMLLDRIVSRQNLIGHTEIHP